MAAALALAACSDGTSYHVGDAERRAMAPLAAPVKLTADVDFCRDVASQNVTSDFDDRSRARLYAVNFRQCMTVFGPPPLRLANLDAGDTGY